jgi:G6PDH family F420-dependent oxidoreductase
MLKLGYKLMSEEHGPRDLLRNAERAEQLGFDFVAISDHYFPWVDAQGHSPFAWSVLGAIAGATERVGLVTAVTCPTVRYHPAIVAQAAATVAQLSDGRFSLGLVSGELLNEHVVAPHHWPAVDQRQAMLGEAIEIIRLLFDGETHSFRGEYLELEEARLYDLPHAPPAILAVAGGPQAAALAAERADGLVTAEPDRKLVQAYRAAGGDGPRYAEVPLCYAPDEEQAHKTLEQFHRWAALGWEILPELRGPKAFEAAAEHVRVEDLAEEIPTGPDVERYVERIGRYAKAGFDHLVLLAVGPDQEAFFAFYEDELGPRLERLRSARN